MQTQVRIISKNKSRERVKWMDRKEKKINKKQCNQTSKSTKANTTIRKKKRLSMTTRVAADDYVQ